MLRISQINSKGAVTAAALTSNRLGYRGGECMSINLTACSGLQLEPKQQEQPEEKKKNTWSFPKHRFLTGCKLSLCSTTRRTRKASSATTPRGTPSSCRPPGERSKATRSCLTPPRQPLLLPFKSCEQTQFRSIRLDISCKIASSAEIT